MHRPEVVFGFGSLVNAATHGYAVAGPAQLNGWHRVWRRSAGYRSCVLSVEPAPGVEIDGLLLRVPRAEAAALDRRESGYDFVDVTDGMRDCAEPVGTYIIPAETAMGPTEGHPILLSYLDVCVQGFLQQFGESGVERFFATTASWGPIRDDRAQPVYPRAQVLSPSEQDTVDRWLGRMAA